MIKLGASRIDIERAAEILNNGGLVAFPTETVYGLGADAFNPLSLARVFKVKNRPHFDPLIIHIAKTNSLEHIACLDSLDSHCRKLLDLLINSFWPGPLTLVLPKRQEVPGLATAGLPAVAIRFPSNPVAQALITLSTGAVAAPSANPFGRLSPTRAEHVMETLGNSIDCIIDGGPCQVGVESTVLEIQNAGIPRILRPGGINRKQLEAIIGPVEDGSKISQEKGNIQCDQNKTAALSAPGMMQSHYAPVVPLFLHSPEEMATLPYHDKEGYLFFSGKNRTQWPTNPVQLSSHCPAILTLSETGNITEAAANLYEYLHILDRSGASCIHAESLPEEGIGEAINDRLYRACHKN